MFQAPLFECFIKCRILLYAMQRFRKFFSPEHKLDRICRIILYSDVPHFNNTTIIIKIICPFNNKYKTNHIFKTYQANEKMSSQLLIRNNTGCL